MARKKSFSQRDSDQKRQFASLVASLICQAGEPVRPKYNAETFSLVGRDQERELHLRNLYDEYQRAPRRGREKLLKIWVRTWFRQASDIPELYEDAKCDLLPAIRRRGSYECEVLAKRLELCCQVFGEHFMAGPVYDFPECKLYLTKKHLLDWHVEFDQVVEVAQTNLREMSREGLQAIAPGCWASAWQDDYDVSRVLLPELLEQCEVKGAHVVMLPHECHLLITGSEDLTGLKWLAGLTEEFFLHLRFLSGIPLIKEGQSWRPFELLKQHPLFRRYQVLKHHTMALDYNWQAKLLNDLYRQEDVFVADTYIKAEWNVADTYIKARWGTITWWGEGIEALLPRTTILGFHQEGVGFEAAAEWELVQEVVGDLLEPVAGIYPERWRVRAYPTPEQIETIKGDGWLTHELRRR